MPNIYSATDDGVIFGAGYVTAEDRSLLLDQARDNGIAGAIDLPGAPAIDLILGLYQYTPTAKVRNQVIKQQDKSLEQAGSEGRQVLRDIDTYLVGINQWYGANRPDARPFDRGDIYALNAIKAQFLGEGGGEEVPNALFLDAARDKFGEGQGHRRLRGPAPAQRSRRRRPRPRARPPSTDERPGQAAEGARAAREGHVQVLRRPAPGQRRGGIVAARASHRRRRTSCWSTGRAPRPARRSWSAARRSATTTPA